MIRLDTTTRKLQVLLGGAVAATQADVLVCYSDKTSTAYTGASQLAVTNNTTAVDICAAPGASTVREVDFVNIRNNDTASITVTVRYNDNGTLYKLFVGTLGVGEQLTYTHSRGWKVCDSSGAEKSLDISGHARNLIVNPSFAINQASYVSGATLASAAYGHDMWKGGASGGDYSFTQSADGCTITIAAAKSLIQVIEDKCVEGGSYLLSWSGTAQARYVINGTTPAGSYASSPIVITGQNRGTSMAVEFNSGTLGNVKLEPGSVVTPFVPRDYDTEYWLTRRYYFRVNSNGSNNAYFYLASSNAAQPTIAFGPMPTIAGMRTTPTVGYSALADINAYDGTNFIALSAITAAFPLEAPIVNMTRSAGNFTAGGIVFGVVLFGTGKYVDFSARL